MTRAVEPPYRSQRGGSRIGIVDGGDGGRAAELAAELGLEMAGGNEDGFDLVLVALAEGLELRKANGRSGSGIRVDFCSSRNARIRTSASRREPLARAVGVSGSPLRVVDATAGLGRDAFQLAALGCDVIAIERSPVLGAMLRDGVLRASTVIAVNDILSSRFELIPGDAVEVLPTMVEHRRPDVVYLDPMFPSEGRSSALAKKEMQLFRMLVGDDDDAGALLEVAMKSARRRVVVKRLRRSPPLAATPDFCQRGKIARYDVYLTRNDETM